MPHSYTSCLMHCVFSTKNRAHFITPDLQERLWPYMGGIARENHMSALAAGGTDDHTHILLSIPAVLPVAKGIQLIKGGSSKWVHEAFGQAHAFAWQEGYGAFSVSIAAVPQTVAYIQGQVQHHRKMTFQEEFLAILRKHGIAYDERYVWG